jgi:hypothetical protein
MIPSLPATSLVLGILGIPAFCSIIVPVLAVVFGVWCLGQYWRQDGVASLVAAVTAFAVSCGLLAYDSWFLRKTRTLR